MQAEKGFQWIGPMDYESPLKRFVIETHEMVTEFHTAFGVPIGHGMTEENHSLIMSRVRLLDEEALELAKALLQERRFAIAAESADLVYVTVGTAVAFGYWLRPNTEEFTPIWKIMESVDRATGRLVVRSPDTPNALASLLWVLWKLAGTHGIDLLAAVREVHRANMSKLDKHGRPTLDEHGKAVKPPHYRAPDMSIALL